MSLSKWILSLLITLLAAGCAAQSGVKPTDLSEIKIGAPRAKVTAAVGEPLARAKTEFGLTEAYTYDRGTDPVLPRSYRGCVGGCAMAHMVGLLLSPLAHSSIVEDQKGRLLIIYDENDRARKIYFGTDAALVDVKPGTSRKFVDFVLGQPVQQKKGASKKEVTYIYKGNGAGSQGEKLKGHVEIRYDENSKVEKIEVVTPHDFSMEEVQRTINEDREKTLKAAKLGDVDAQYEMWYRFSDGERWLCLAAHNGEPSAQVDMGKRYWSGSENYSQNRPLAFMWFSLSAKKDNYRGRKEVLDKKPLLNIKEIVSAEKLIAEWKPDPKSCGNEDPGRSAKTDVQH